MPGKAAMLWTTWTLLREIAGSEFSCKVVRSVENDRQANVKRGTSSEREGVNSGVNQHYPDPNHADCALTPHHPTTPKLQVDSVEGPIFSGFYRSMHSTEAKSTARTLARTRFTYRVFQPTVKHPCWQG